ncbi:hypothetical protein [Streptomyces sp. NPDC048462]|uniref:hypothetical protein n=1 Tax=Streptomyces sp. NPDC048462 TaxID=3365555 RepID=UPI003717B0AD
MRTVMDIDDLMLDGLSEDWEEMRQNYQAFQNGVYDRSVLDCAAELTADPGGEYACIWTIGPTLMAPYLTWLPGEGVAQQAVTALEVAGAPLPAGCPHEDEPAAAG